MGWLGNILVSLILLSCAQALQMDDCLEINDPTLCYLCDSDLDQHCGDPFGYSHYYSSKELYFTECQGCCIKIVHPSHEGSPRRILRSCTDNLPRLNYTLEESCYSQNEQDRKICICEKELCNSSTNLHANLLRTVFITSVFYFIKNII